MLVALLLSWFLSYVLADCPTVSNPIDRRSNSSTFRFVQFNAEWLFLDYYASADCPGNGCPWHNTTAANTHLDYIANVIKTLNPDTVHVCEVEGCDELNALVERTSIDTYKPYLVKGTDTATGQNVGMITKIDPSVSLYRTEDRAEYPIPNSTCGYTGEPGTSGVSKHLITEFVIQNIPIALIGTHLLAYPTDKTRCAEREAQAQVLQSVITKYIDKGYEIIVSGDLNDFDGVVLDANSNKPISSVLDILKGDVLRTVGEKITQDDRFSDWYDQNGNCVASSNEFSQLDHILVSSKLYDHISGAFMYHDYKEYCGTYDSDHYPLVVDFEF
jgi:exonuclease III